MQTEIESLSSTVNNPVRANRLANRTNLQPVNERLKWIVNNTVRINRGGKESKQGSLMAAKDDHLVLLTDEQYLYFQTHHVKSITIDTTMIDAIDAIDAPVVQPDNRIPKCLDVDRFRDVLEKMIYRSVEINVGGPDAVKGVLTQVFDDHVDLVCNHEIVKVATFHIRNIGYDLSNQAKTSNNNTSAESENQGKEQAQTEDKAVWSEAQAARSEGKTGKSRANKVRKTAAKPVVIPAPLFSAQNRISGKTAVFRIRRKRKKSNIPAKLQKKRRSIEIRKKRTNRVIHMKKRLSKKRLSIKNRRQSKRRNLYRTWLAPWIRKSFAASA
jgi:spore coat protein B